MPHESKASKLNLSQAEQREVDRLEKYILACLGVLALLVLFEFIFRILGWCILLLAIPPSGFFLYFNRKVELLKEKGGAFKNMKPNTRRYDW